MLPEHTGLQSLFNTQHLYPSVLPVMSHSIQGSALLNAYYPVSLVFGLCPFSSFVFVILTTVESTAHWLFRMSFNLDVCAFSKQ